MFICFKKGLFQEQEGLLVSRTASCLFQEPLKEERTGVLLLCSRKPGFVYLFQEWFVSRTRRRPGEEPGVVQEEEEEPGVVQEDNVVSC